MGRGFIQGYERDLERVTWKQITRPCPACTARKIANVLQLWQSCDMLESNVRLLSKNIRVAPGVDAKMLAQHIYDQRGLTSVSHGNTALR